MFVLVWMFLAANMCVSMQAACKHDHKQDASVCSTSLLPKAVMPMCWMTYPEKVSMGICTIHVHVQTAFIQLK